jgi:hypothetical protein
MKRDQTAWEMKWSEFPSYWVELIKEEHNKEAAEKASPVKKTQILLGKLNKFHTSKRTKWVNQTTMKNGCLIRRKISL